VTLGSAADEVEEACIAGDGHFDDQQGCYKIVARKR
jgi:hypothetical protein